MKSTAISKKREHSIKEILFKYNSALILLGLIIVSSLISEVFFTEANWTNLLRQITPTMLMSIGMLLVILTGGIDLSVGSLYALGGIILALLITQHGFESTELAWLAALLAVLGAAGLGAISGVLVSVFKMAPFIVTLAMMSIVKGISFILTGGYPVPIRVEGTAMDFIGNIGSGRALGLPIPILIMVIVVVIFWFVMRYTSFGRLTLATGSNEAAVLLAGVSVARYKFLPYLISGALSALGGILITARAGTGSPVVGDGIELDVIAAVVVGGARMSGGKGSVINTVIGVVILGLLGNIMNLMAVPSYPQQIIRGVIIIMAVLLQSAAAKSEKK